MTGRQWTVETTAGAIRIGKSRDRPGSPRYSLEKLTKSDLSEIETTLQIEIACLQIERRTSECVERSIIEKR